MCRIFGAIAKCNVVPYIVYAGVAADYGHEKRTGARVFDGQKFLGHQENGPAINVFGRLDLSTFKGHIGVGHNACATGAESLELMSGRHSYVLSVDATREVTNKIVEVIDGTRNFEEAVRQAMLRVEEPFALILAHRNGLIGARNRGLKPLTFGEIVGVNSDLTPEEEGKHLGYYISSQSCVLGSAGRYVHTVNPGEMLIVENGGRPTRHAVIARPDITRCMMEVLFLQRPDNICGGRQICHIRQAIGLALGEKLVRKVLNGRDCSDILAICIPVGGNFFLYGLSEGAKIKADPGIIVKSRYPRGNVPILPWMRDHYRYTLVSEKGVASPREIVLVNDLMRSGGIARDITTQLREELDTEIVHLAVAGITLSSCPYQFGAYTFTGKARAHSIKTLGVESLTYLNSREIERAINNPHRIYCTRCLEH